jgi:hypothetical protein
MSTAISSFEVTATTADRPRAAPRAGQSIVCFAKDWDEDPTSNNHVMAELARQNRVLWLNSISTRTPRLTSGRDLKKIVRKVASLLKGARRVQDDLWVYTPIVLPFPHNRFATVLNRFILRATVRILRRRLKMGDDFQLWTFLPNVADYVGRLGESVVVYYCVDEWSKFSYVDGDRIAAAERLLCQRADIVFATAQSLVDRRRHLNPQIHLASHGVDFDKFSAALDDRLQVPPDVAALPRPVLGFYGTVQDWVDLDLIAFLARRHSEWSIAVVGNVLADVSSLAAYPNVHFLGRRPHAQLPAYCKGFTVGLIPQKVNDLTRHMNPIKLREYLCAGLPVVATALPEVACYRDLCTVANGYDEFEQGVVDAIRSDTPELRRRRSDAMRGETWERKVAEIYSQVMRVKDGRA